MSRGRVIFFPVRIGPGGRYTDTDAFMLTCISEQPHAIVQRMKQPEQPTWAAVIRRMLAAEFRPDPDDPERMKIWTQGDLAKVAKVRPNTLSDLMTGRGADGPKVETLRAVARALKVPVFYLLMTEEEARTYMHGAQAQKAMVETDAIKERILEALAPTIEQALDRAIGGEIKPVEKRRKR